MGENTTTNIITGDEKRMAKKYVKILNKMYRPLSFTKPAIHALVEAGLAEGGDASFIHVNPGMSSVDIESKTWDVMVKGNPAIGGLIDAGRIEVVDSDGPDQTVPVTEKSSDPVPPAHLTEPEKAEESGKDVKADFKDKKKKGKPFEMPKAE